MVNAPFTQNQSPVLNGGRFFLHALLLTALTWCAVAAIYFRPRFYASGRPRPDDQRWVAKLCAHPDSNSRDWRYVVIHHSATTGGSAAAFERYHIHTRQWKSLGYHFVIGNGTQTGDGEIEVGPRWVNQNEGSHTAGYNAQGIGICLVGNFEVDEPSSAQIAALRQLVLHLITEHDIPASHVLGHNECEGAQTACPGQTMNMDKLRLWLDKQLHASSGQPAQK